MPFLEYHVDWSTEGGDREHSKQVGSYAAACALARRKSDSDKTTGSAEIMVYENSGPTPIEGTLTTVGCVTYWNGRRDSVEGRVK